MLSTATHGLKALVQWQKHLINSSDGTNISMEINIMSRLTMKMKLALGIAGAVLAGGNAHAQDYFQSYEPYAANYNAAHYAETPVVSPEDEGPWTLFNFENLNVGGWFQGGFHDASNDLFNSRPDTFNLHQAWLFVEKVAEPRDDGRLGFGFRFDGMYGADANDTQSFGNNPGRFDLDDSFQRGGFGGGFGWAIPQAYGEVAGDDWSVKIGHFYTLVGYEVVTAPDNFFYSHAITMYNSEPFTHTGAVGTFNVSDDTTIYAGWTLGWDTGFDQFGGGSSFLGGISTALTEATTMTYITTIGDFGARGSDAYSHSFVFDTAVTDRFNYVLQSDLVRVDSTGEDNVGINQYFLYDINDNLAAGVRAEWWKGDTLTGYAPHGGTLPASGSHSYYDVTVGLNIKPNQNFIIRPEYRYDWSPALNYEEGYIGVDFIALY